MNDRPVPAKVDRETFDRLLRRAAELQAASRDIGDGLSEAEVLELGREVGIPEAHLRQALLEERTRAMPAAPEGILDRWVAPAEFSAERVVQGTEEQVVAALSSWLERHEHFVVQRATLGRLSYEPMDTFARGMRKLKGVFDGGRGRSYLDKAELLTAVVTPLEAGFCHVTLAARIRGTRSAYVAGGAGLATAGTVMGALAVVLGAPEVILAVAAVPSAGAGWLVTRAFRPVAERTRLGLERALDELERRPALPPGTAPRGSPIAREIGNVVRDISKEVRRALEEK